MRWYSSPVRTLAAVAIFGSLLTWSRASMLWHSGLWNVQAVGVTKQVFNPALARAWCGSSSGVDVSNEPADPGRLVSLLYARVITCGNAGTSALDLPWPLSVGRSLDQFKYGWLLEARGDRGRAVEMWRQAGAGAYFVGLAQHAWGDRNMENVRANLSLAEQIDGTLSSAWLLEADVAIAAGDTMQASRALKQAALDQRAPESQRCIWQARAAVLERDWDAALDRYGCAAQLDPGGPENPLYRIGEVYLWSGNSDKAGDYFRISIQQQPRFIWGYIRLGDMALEEGQVSEAIDWYRKAVEAAPTDGTPSTYLGRALYQSGQYDLALAEFARALALLPERQDIHVWLARCYAGRQDYRGAIAEYQSAIAHEPSRLDYQIELSRVLVSDGQPEAAVRLLESVLRLDPANTEALEALDRARAVQP